MACLLVIILSEINFVHISEKVGTIDHNGFFVIYKNNFKFVSDNLKWHVGW